MQTMSQKRLQASFATSLLQKSDAALLVSTCSSTLPPPLLLLLLLSRCARAPPLRTNSRAALASQPLLHLHHPSLRPLPRKAAAGAERRNESAPIMSLKTLLAPYLWRTFNSRLPQTALPPLQMQDQCASERRGWASTRHLAQKMKAQFKKSCTN